MDLARRSLWCLVVATAAIGLMAASARADIVLFANYLVPSPIGNPAAELAFVQLATGDTLDLFQKNDADGIEQLFTVESVSVTKTFGTLWHLDWTTVDWDIRYILVKDGATHSSDGEGNGGGGGGGGGNDGEGSDGEGDAGQEHNGYFKRARPYGQVLPSFHATDHESPGGQQIYSLWEVKEAQFKDGGGDVFLQQFPAKDISHITIFGQNNPTNVPEPTTLLLLGVGLLGTVALGRRHR